MFTDFNSVTYPQLLLTIVSTAHSAFITASGFHDTVGPPYTVIIYLINSQLRFLVITTLDSIYAKKNSQIWYLLVFCLHRTVSPPRCAATNQSLPAFHIKHKLNPYGVIFVILLSQHLHLCLPTHHNMNKG